MSAWSWRKTADQVRLGCLYPIKHISKINFLRRVGELYTHSDAGKKRHREGFFSIFSLTLIQFHAWTALTPFVPADAGNEMVQPSARWGSSQDMSAFILLGLIVPVFQAAFPVVLDWMLFDFPTRSLGLNIDHLPLHQQSTQTLCCSLFLSGSWNCSGWF